MDEIIIMIILAVLVGTAAGAISYDAGMETRCQQVCEASEAVYLDSNDERCRCEQGGRVITIGGGR